MQTALKHLSKEDLLAMVSDRDRALAERNEKIIILSHETSKKDEEIGYLKSQLAMYRRMQFGQKRERFEGDPNQTALPFEAASVEVVEQQEETKQKTKRIEPLKHRLE